MRRSSAANGRLQWNTTAGRCREAAGWTRRHALHKTSAGPVCLQLPMKRQCGPCTCVWWLVCDGCGNGAPENNLHAFALPSAR